MYKIREAKVMFVGEETSSENICSPSSVFRFMKDKICDDTRENFCALVLNNKNTVTAWQIVSVGTVSQTIVHPREVFRLTVMNNGSSIIIVHNHPSGETTPSREDITATHRLIEAGEILGIPVLDHVVLSCSGFCSMKEDGLM